MVDNKKKDVKEFITNQVVGSNKIYVTPYKDLCYNSDYSKDENLTPEEYAERVRKVEELQAKNDAEKRKKYEQERSM